LAVHFRFSPARGWQLAGASAFLAGAVALFGSCSPSGGASAGADTPSAQDVPADPSAKLSSTRSANAPGCAATRETLGPLPKVEPGQLTPDYWFELLGRQFNLDQVLLSPQQIDNLNQALQVPRPDYHSQRDLLQPFDPVELGHEVQERRTWARDKLSSGEYLSAAGAKLPPAALGALDADVNVANAAPELRVALADAQIHCAPLDQSFYTSALDLRLDRNACSMLRAQEPVRVVAAWPNGMQLVQSASSFGWLAPSAPLSAPLPAPLAQAYVHGLTLRVRAPDFAVGHGEGRTVVAPGTLLPVADARQGRVHVATKSGFVTSSREQAALLESTRRPLTRRAVLEEAFRYLGQPYGLGDSNGGRDCSRLLQDVFESFDLQLPRHSSWQAQAGSFWIDIDAVPETERGFLFDAAAQRGIVLLAFPGHIMLYLGRNARGEPMVLHALGEYVEPCAGGGQGETLVRVKNISVSNLELGRGTSRKALIERITRVTVIGGAPGLELAGVAQQRPAPEARIPADRACHDSEQAALYALPEQPNHEQPLRVLSAVSYDPGPATLTLIDPDGQRIQPPVVRLGGPPYSLVATIEHPKRGRWKAVLADGNDVKACQRIAVGPRRPRPAEPSAGPIWLPKYKWNVANENLYALFVERLFDYPLEDDRTWSSLHPLLRDAERNLLFDYRGQQEDGEITFAPDCADLPYVLRSYFAWKMRLPFGFKHCSRGREGKPPSCDLPGAGDNLMSRLELPGKSGLNQPHADVEAFQLFVNHFLRRAVHSSSGRTLPEDELGDLYPVPLTRQALKPGTVFADPYGHMLVLADWVPQPLTGSGILIGADAQPDGTVGQRRFWRGTFLFDPDTSSGGAGFKAFRPRLAQEQPVSVEIQAEGQPVTVERVGSLQDVDNAELKKTRRYTPLSLQQYKGSADDFYDSVEGLINPRPLEPKTFLLALLDAFAESVLRRVTSIDNAEKWRVEHPDDVVAMPDGDSIFLANGPWEDFSTPSRDLRLLISIDTVVGFSKRVRAAPQRFGLAPAAVDLKLKELEQLLQSELAKRSFSYTRSDGSAQKLSLQQVVERSSALELAYNPNDCAEVRWGAPPGSDEAATCHRHTPPDQAAKMASYRHWFATRKRPPQ
jgi:cell wall-associated NlpC family hydrolase